jgi:hypothetical protein
LFTAIIVDATMPIITGISVMMRISRLPIGSSEPQIRRSVHPAIKEAPMLFAKRDLDELPPNIVDPIDGKTIGMTASPSVIAPTRKLIRISIVMISGDIKGIQLSPF